MNAPVLNQAVARQQHFWDWRAAGNYIGGGSGAGALIYAALAWPGGRPVVLAGLALVGLGLLCVWAEIGRPLRAFNVFFNPATSWMTREAVVATLLLPLGLAAWGLASAGLAAAAALLAAGYVYCQARMIQAARGIPAWRHTRTVPLMLATGLAEGAGIGLAVQVVIGGTPPAWAAAWLAGLVVLRELAFAAWRRGLAQAGAPRGTHAVIGGFGGRLAGLDAAAVVLAAAWALWQDGTWLAATAGLAAALGGGWFKLTLVTRAAYHQGLAIPVTPVRGAGTTHPGARPGW